MALVKTSIGTPSSRQYSSVTMCPAIRAGPAFMYWPLLKPARWRTPPISVSSVPSRTVQLRPPGRPRASTIVHL